MGGCALDNSNVPVLRFAEFDGDWESQTIQSLIDNDVIIGHLDGNHGELYPRSEEFSSEGVPYVSANDLDGRSVSLEKSKRLSKARADKFKKGIAKSGDVLFAHNATVGPTALLDTDLEYIILSTTVTYFRCDLNLLNNSFLLISFQSKYFVKQYSRVMSQSTRNQVPITTQRKFYLSLPSLPEQKKIANFLSAVDSKIEQLGKKKALLEQYKKGVMQQIFNGKLKMDNGKLSTVNSQLSIRFKDASTGLSTSYPDWEVKRLGDVVTFKRGKGISKSDIVENGKTPCIRYGELYTEYAEKISSPISSTNVSEDDLILSKGNEVLIPSSGETAIDIATASCILQKDVALGGDINILSTKEDGVFLAFLLKNHYKISIAKLGQGNSVVHLYAKDLSLLKLSLPSLPEQQKIASFLSALDKKIEATQAQISQTETFKKGLLQKMFV